MKKLFLLSTLFLCHKIYAQDIKSEMEKILNQPDLTFRISWNTINGDDTLPKFTMSVAVDDSVKKKFKLLSKDELKEFIDNKATQWNTNLFLYEMYNLDALPFWTIDNDKKWESSFKKSDLKHWNEVLSASSENHVKPQILN